MLCKKNPLPSRIRKRLVLFLRLHALFTMPENDAVVSVILTFYPKNVIKLIKLLIMLITNKNQYLRTL